MNKNIYINKSAFTLIELIVVIVILAVLVLLGIPKMNNYQKEARLTNIKNNIKVLEGAAERYYIDYQKWPRGEDDDDYFTKEELEDYANEFLGVTGESLFLDPEGKYYLIDYSALNEYVYKPKDGFKYIIQNPIGNVVYIDNLTESGKEIFDDRQKEPSKTQKPIAIISMNPSNSITTATNINWSYDSSTSTDGKEITNVEWQLNDGPITSTPNEVIGRAGEYKMKLRVQDSSGNWSNWTQKTFYVDAVKSLYFNGNSYLNVPTLPEYDLKQNLTIEAWVKTSSSSYGTIAGRWGSVGGASFILTMESGGYLGFKIHDGSENYILQSDKKITYGEWTHVAGVVKDNSRMELYINGELIAFYEKSNLLNQNPLYDFRVGLEAVNNYGYTGYVKDVRLWNTSRTQQEIQSNMLTKTINHSNLIGHWKLDEESGTIGNDSSYLKNNGTVYATWKN